MLRKLSYFMLLVSFLMLSGCLIEGTIADGESEPVPDVNVSFGAVTLIPYLAIMPLRI